MKKLTKIFIALLFITLSTVALISCNTDDPPSMNTVKQGLSDAFENFSAAHSVDISISLTLSTDYLSCSDHLEEDRTVSVRAKTIQKDEESIAHVIDSSNRNHYYYNGKSCYDYGYNLIYFEALDQFLRNNEVMPMPEDIDFFSDDIKISWKIDGKLVKYSFIINEEQMKEYFDGMFKDDDILFGADFSVWLDEDAFLKKMQFALDYQTQDKSHALSMLFEINALNNAVSIEIPDEVKHDLNLFGKFFTLTVIHQKEDEILETQEYSYLSKNSVKLYQLFNDNLAFEGWYIDDINVGSSSIYYFGMPKHDLTIVAKYTHRVPIYIVSLEVYGEGAISSVVVNGKEGDFIISRMECKADTAVTVIAKPEKYWAFVGWFDGDNCVSTSLKYTFAMPAKSFTLVAKFKPFGENYINNNAVSYYNLEQYQKAVFDPVSKRLVVLNQGVITIYSEYMLELHTINLYSSHVAMDADGGILATATQASVNLYSLDTFELIKTINTEYYYDPLILDGDTLIFPLRDYLVFYNINTDKTIKKNYSLSNNFNLAINRESHLLYLEKKDSASSNLFIFNSQTSELLYMPKFSSYYNTNIEFRFDGEFLHYRGRVLDAFFGTTISSSRLSQHYNPLNDFNPAATVSNIQNLSFVLGENNTLAEVGIYDTAQQKYIYRFNFLAESIVSMGDDRYLALNANNTYVAIIDLGQTIGEIEGNQPPEYKEAMVKIESDSATLTHFEDYDLYASDDDYVYLVNKDSLMLVVYDKSNFSEVYRERLLMMPFCMDAYGGNLALGFGSSRAFRIYDTNNWTNKTVVVSIDVFSLVIYNNLIFYVDSNISCTLYGYNLKQNTHFDYDSSIGSLYRSHLAINREDGILYIGETELSSDLIYFCLKTYKILYKFEFGESFYSNTPVRFDGGFVYYFDRVYHKTSGELISSLPYSRTYDVEDCENIFTLYDNHNISIFTAIQSGNPTTIFYSLDTDEIILQLDVGAFNIHKTANGFIVFAQNRTVISLSLAL